MDNKKQEIHSTAAVNEHEDRKGIQIHEDCS
jgi:hypothetical protein